MEVSQNLLDTWKRSELQIQVSCKWLTLWDGERLYLDALPKEVEGRDIYILTAYNPGSEPLPDAENKKRDKELFQRLSSLGPLGLFTSVGRSLSGSHEEFGYAVFRVSKSDIDRLALEFGQIGYYRFSSGALQIFVLDENGEFVPI